jgi:hypothetical protein
MFGKKQAARQTALANQLQSQANQSLQQAAKPAPLQDYLSGLNLDFLKEVHAPDFDVTASKSMSPYLSLYQNSIAAKNSDDDAGRGLFQLGSEGATNPYLKEYQNARRQQAAAGQLSDAFNRAYADAEGSVIPLSSLSQQRNLSVAGLANSASENAWARALQAQRSAGFLNSPLFRLLQQGAVGYASAPRGDGSS